MVIGEEMDRRAFQRRDRAERLRKWGRVQQNRIHTGGENDVVSKSAVGLPGDGCGVECLVFSLTRTSSSSVRSSSCLEELSSRLSLSCLVLRLPLPLLSETVGKLHFLFMTFLVLIKAVMSTGVKHY